MVYTVMKCSRSLENTRTKLFIRGQKLIQNIDIIGSQI